MMANTGNRASPHWRTLCEAAILELDRDKLPQRITEAWHAIMDRMRVLILNGSDGGSDESQALMDGLNALRHLQKMADV